MHDRKLPETNGFTKHHFLSGGHGSSPVPSKKSGAGFTLIELLVVISIIGFLASIALVNLNGARVKARVASAKANLKSIHAGAALCQHSNADLTNNAAVACNGTNSTPISGAVLCNTVNTAGIGTWPPLPSSAWAYNNFCNSDKGVGTFRYGASGDGCSITCSEIGCSFGTGC